MWWRPSSKFLYRFLCCSASVWHFSWNNENLLGGTESKKMCQTVRTCDIVEREDSRTVRVPRQQCDNIPYTRKKCGSIQVPQPPIEVPTMEYRTEYKQQCYNVPKPVCRMEPCTYQVKQAPVCPTCINGSPGPDCNSQVLSLSSPSTQAKISCYLRPVCVVVEEEGPAPVAVEVPVEAESDLLLTCVEPAGRLGPGLNSHSHSTTIINFAAKCPDVHQDDSEVRHGE